MAKMTVARFSSLDEARRYYLDAVDRWAQSASPSPTAHKTTARRIKLDEARSYPLRDSYPLLEAESSALGEPLSTVVSRVLSADRSSRTDRNFIEVEQRRIRAKNQIRLSSTPAEMAGILGELS